MLAKQMRCLLFVAVIASRNSGTYNPFLPMEKGLCTKMFSVKPSFIHGERADGNSTLSLPPTHIPLHVMEDEGYEMCVHTASYARPAAKRSCSFTLARPVKWMMMTMRISALADNTHSRFRARQQEIMPPSHCLPTVETERESGGARSSAGMEMRSCVAALMRQVTHTVIYNAQTAIYQRIISCYYMACALQTPQGRAVAS